MKKTLFSAKNYLSKQRIILIITLIVLIFSAIALVITPILIWGGFTINNAPGNALIVLQADFDSYGFNVELFLFITIVVALAIVFIGIIVCVVFLIKVAIVRKQRLVIEYDNGNSEYEDINNNELQKEVMVISESQGENTNV